MFRSDRTLGATAALILAAACWGLGTVISKHALDEFPPLTLLAIQLAASVVVLGAALRLRGWARPTTDPSAARALGRLGLLNPGLGYLLGLLGLASISASLSVMLWTTEPILILLLAALVLRERVGRSFVALSGLAAAGLLLILYEPGSTGSLAGILLTLAGVLCCAVYTILARRWLGDGDAPAPIVVAQQTYALGFAVVAVVLVSVAGGVLLPSQVSVVGLGSAIGSGVLYYGAAYWCYLSALRRLPASQAAASFYLIPVFGVGGGVLLLGERLGPEQWVGTVLVVLAVLLILRGRRTEPPEPEAPTVSAIRPGDTISP